MVRSERIAMAIFCAGLAVFWEPGANQAWAQSQEARIPGLQLSGDQPIQIESDRLEVRESDNLAVFTGNVSVTQGSTLLKSGRMTVHYTKDSGSVATGSASIERLEVDEKVYLRSNDQVATGDRGTFDMKTEVLVLSGRKVVLSEKDNVLVGCRLTVRMKTGQAQVEGCGEGEDGSGRVMMSIIPDSAKK